MRKSIILLTFISILILFIGVLPTAAASPPVDVLIEVGEYITGPGDFHTYGPAASGGHICDSGTTIDLFVKGQPGKNLQVIKEFICDDESGTFIVKLQVKFDKEDPSMTHFKWNITGGTNAYASLKGGGTGVGLPTGGPYDIFDIYNGKVH